MGRSVCNCTKDEKYILISMRGKKLISTGYFLKGGTIASACTVEFI